MKQTDRTIEEVIEEIRSALKELDDVSAKVEGELAAYEKEAGHELSHSERKAFASFNVQEKNRMMNRIRKRCRYLASLVDLQGEVRANRDKARTRMKQDISNWFLTCPRAFFSGAPVNERTFDAFANSFVSRAQKILIYGKAYPMVFRGDILPSEYVIDVIRAGLAPDKREALSFLEDVENKYGIGQARQMQSQAMSIHALGTAELSDVITGFTRRRIVNLLSRNPNFAVIFESKKQRLAREARVKSGLLDAIPGTYPELFPLARGTYRHFILHIGPTNSGKSYDALEALKKAENGIYLAPLRLLAYEKFEELNAAGCWCTLKTGEEEIQVPGASLQSSTIEMLDFTTFYDVAVIDEAQMIANPQRGSSWTMALLGVRARTVHVCLAPEAEQAVKAIIKACNDTFEVVRHKRFVPLVYENDSPVEFPMEVERGTAFIVFSRKDVHAVAGELQRNGYNCSVIYGALPYDVRRNEVRRYMNGETDIVVATDAIGMGLNLPIKRVVFLRVSKFDGFTARKLNATEIKQIAGRAGRYGMYDKGYVFSEEDEDLVREALNARIPQIKEARIGFPYSLIGIDGSISQLMRKWCEIEAKPGFEVANLDREIELAEELEQETADKTLVYRFVMFPFDEKDRDLKAIWHSLFACERDGTERIFMSFLPSIPEEDDSLEDLEQAFRICDLLYHYTDSFVGRETGELDIIARRKNQISAVIMEKLSSEQLSMRSCRICGRPLPFNYKYSVCVRCYRKSRGK